MPCNIYLDAHTHVLILLACPDENPILGNALTQTELLSQLYSMAWPITMILRRRVWASNSTLMRSYCYRRMTQSQNTPISPSFLAHALLLHVYLPRNIHPRKIHSCPGPRRWYCLHNKHPPLAALATATDGGRGDLYNCAEMSVTARVTHHFPPLWQTCRSWWLSALTAMTLVCEE